MFSFLDCAEWIHAFWRKNGQLTCELKLFLLKLCLGLYIRICLRRWALNAGSVNVNNVNDSGELKKIHILGQNFCCRLAEQFWGIYTQIEGSPAFCDLRIVRACLPLVGAWVVFFLSLSWVNLIKMTLKYYKLCQTGQEMFDLPGWAHKWDLKGWISFSFTESAWQ